VDCANANCSNEMTTLGCENIAGNAAAGPATGQAKSALCIALLKCDLTANCGGSVDDAGTVSGSVANCYCGSAGGADCFVGGSTNNGACMSDEQNGLETTTPATIQSRFQTTSYGGGRANKIVNCLNINGCGSCLH
jgi:hypothetical protein